MLEEKTGVPVLGVVPYTRADIDDEDSLAPCLAQTQQRRPLDIAVVRLPRISNFTDFSPLESHPALGVRYVERAGQLGEPDLVVLPGTKNTMGDLAWMRQNGLEAAVKKLAAAGTPVLGVCGGYQMLGTALDDPDGVEQGGRMDGMGLLPCATRFTGQKVRTRVQACAAAGPFAGAQLDGYEIHMGRTERGGTPPFCLLADGTPEGAAAKLAEISAACTGGGFALLYLPAGGSFEAAVSRFAYTAQGDGRVLTYMLEFVERAAQRGVGA